MRNTLSSGSFVLGSAALFTAMAVDFASVIARHVGWRVLGSIEVIQLCIVAAISAAIVMATASGSHAAVHLFTARMRPRMRAVFLRASEAMTALLFLLFLIGDGWIAVELWPLGERSDLLGLPFAPARGLWCLSMAFAAALALGSAIRGRGLDSDHGA